MQGHIAQKWAGNCEKAIEHSYERDVAGARAQKFRSEVVDDGAREIASSSRAILETRLLNVEEAVLAKLSKKQTIGRGIRKAKRKAQVVHPVPCMRNFIIPEELTGFIVGDTGADDADHILAIADSQVLLSASNSEWFGDDSFDKCPTPFYQFYSIHCKIGQTYPRARSDHTSPSAWSHQFEACGSWGREQRRLLRPRPRLPLVRRFVLLTQC